MILFAVSSRNICQAEIIAVSNIEQCVDDGTSPAYNNGSLCNKKLVVAVTVNGDEVRDVTFARGIKAFLMNDNNFVGKIPDDNSEYKKSLR